MRVWCELHLLVGHVVRAALHVAKDAVKVWWLDVCICWL